MKDATSPFRVVLNGEWTMQQAGDLRELLRETLADLHTLDPRPTTAELDLAEISDLDACGCQLLAIFLENLRRLGVAPLPYGTSAELLEKITVLGFAGAFFPVRAAGKEAA
jgi:anti-anti-sigma regulatory factor